ncbi:MAG: hypothetical protein AAB497_03450, partial [Patescibacteria group bacterium]
MNFLNLLTKEKLVAGIEISDSVIRIAFFRAQNKKYKNERRVEQTTDNKQQTTDGVRGQKEQVERRVSEELVLIEEPIAAN